MNLVKLPHSKASIYRGTYDVDLGIHTLPAGIRCGSRNSHSASARPADCINRHGSVKQLLSRALHMLAEKSRRCSGGMRYVGMFQCRSAVDRACGIMVCRASSVEPCAPSLLPPCLNVEGKLSALHAVA